MKYSGREKTQRAQSSLFSRSRHCAPSESFGSSKIFCSAAFTLLLRSIGFGLSKFQSLLAAVRRGGINAAFLGCGFAALCSFVADL